MQKIKKYIVDNEIEIDFNFRFSEKAGILSFLETALRCRCDRIEDKWLKLELKDREDKGLLNKFITGTLRKEITSEIAKHQRLSAYIEDFDCLYERDKYLLEDYFIRFEEEISVFCK
jgi:hypothetical protein